MVEETRVAMLTSHMPFVTLVVNCGSSSVKLAVIAADGRQIDNLSVEGFGPTATLTADRTSRPVDAPDFAAAIGVAFSAVDRHGPVLAAEEAATAAAAVARWFQEQRDRSAAPPIPIAVSARHIHLTVASVEALFGVGHRLTVYREISQPGQFAAVECLRLVGPKGAIDRVRVIGPERFYDQVEISRTDGFLLGITAPVRESGDIADSPGVRLEGPAGVLELSAGVIYAKRHVHMTPQDAQVFGVSDGDMVAVHTGSRGGRALTFGDVRVRVSDRFQLEMHIDTDEANAAGIGSGAEGALVANDRAVVVCRSH